MGTHPGSAPSDLGQLLIIGIEGTALTPATRGLLQEIRPGGVVLFRRNVPSLPELASLCTALKETMDPPPLLAIDEEGGRVTRLAPHVTGLPAASSIAGAGGDALRDYWSRYGELLRVLGLDIDFAPVLDLCPPDAANGIADRSFGTDPELVTACAASVLQGLRSSGVLPTLKHFPGLGPTLLDSHHRLPSVTKGREAFQAEDLAPWRRLAPGEAVVMIAHGHYPFYSGADPVAATLSPEVGTTLLRETLGFGGVAVSDDLEMKAVADRVPWDELAPRVVEAGSDMLLVCHRADRIRACLDALKRRADRDGRFADRCAQALDRIVELRRACAVVASGGSGPGEGTALPAQIEETRAALERAASEVSRASA